VAAALKTKTNKVAYIGGQEFPSTAEEVAAFEQGVKDTNPAVAVSVTWVDSWSDQAKASEIALAQIADGADVLAVDADIAGLAILELAADNEVQVIGWVQDQNPLAPDAVITSVLQRLDAMFLEAAILVKEGRWEGKQYRLGLHEGVVDLSPLYGDWTPEQQDMVKQAKEGIIAGKIEILP
jgi:basic membrane protein A